MFEEQSTFSTDVANDVASLASASLRSEERFLRASRAGHRPQFRALCRMLAAQRRRFHSDLSRELTLIGSALSPGPVVAPDPRAAGDLQLLEQCIEGEERLLDDYRNLLEAMPPSAIYQVIEQHYSEVRAGQDRLKALRAEFLWE